MMSMPVAVSRVRRAHARVVSQELLRRLRLWAVPAVAVIVGVLLVAFGIIGQSAATLPVDVHVISTGDPMHLGATTQATVQLTNRGSDPVRPRFSVSWLPYPYYWKVASGPEVLRSGETASYDVEAPDSVAAPHDGERFQIKVNDATSITYAISAPITDGAGLLPIVNPALKMWTQQDPASGLFSPAGWRIYRHTAEGNTAIIQPVTQDGRDSGYFHVTQTRQGDPSEWTQTGLQQDIPFPNQPLDVQVLSRVPYEAISDGWLVTAFGIEVSYGKHESIWLLFEPTGSGDKEYDLPNGQHIKVYDVPFGQWTTRTIDVGALYKALNWAPRQHVTLKLFMGISSYAKADIDGYIAGVGVHETGAATTGR